MPYQNAVFVRAALEALGIIQPALLAFAAVVLIVAFTVRWRMNWNE